MNMENEQDFTEILMEAETSNPQKLKVSRVLRYNFGGRYLVRDNGGKFYTLAVSDYDARNNSGELKVDADKLEEPTWEILFSQLPSLRSKLNK